MIKYCTSFIAFINLLFWVNSAELPNAESVFPDLKDRKEGIYDSEGLTLIVAVVPMEEHKSPIIIKGRAMIKSKDMIKRRLINPFIASPPIVCDRLKKGISAIAAAQIPFEIKCETRVLQNGEQDGGYRYVTVYRTDDIEAARPKIENKLAPWIAAFRKFLSDFRSRDDMESIVILYSEIGSIEDSLTESKIRLGAKFNLTTIFPLEMTDNQVFYANVLSGIKLSESDTKAALDICPGLPSAIAALAKSRRNEKDWEGALLCQLLLLSSRNSLLNNNLNEATSNIPRENSKAWKEYQKLLNDYFKSPPQSKNDKIEYVLRTCGHAAFAKAESKISPSGFDNAVEMFSQGRDLNEIIELLKTCIRNQSAHAESWAYLGACFLAKNEDEKALAFLSQSIFLDNENPLPKANLANLYDRMGYPELARGMAWSAIATDKNGLLVKYNYKLEQLIMRSSK